jgi:hypothetical protein
MRPTIEEQLDGALRLLGRAATDEGISAESEALLGNARRLIARVRASWATVLPFLLEDNARLAALLELPPPEDPATDLVADLVAAERRNRALRAALTEVITAAPHTAEELANRARIARYLRQRIAADPS